MIPLLQQIRRTTTEKRLEFFPWGDRIPILSRACRAVNSPRDGIGIPSHPLFGYGALDAQLHQHGEVVAVATFPLLVGAAEAPRAFFSVLGLVQLIEDLHAVRIARPTLIVEQAGRDEDLVEDVPLLVIVGAECLGVLGGRE